MPHTSDTITSRMGLLCRNVAVSVVAGVCRWRSFDEINEEFKARPVANQAIIVAAIIAALFALSLAAGYFGWVGILVYWLGVILLVN